MTLAGGAPRRCLADLEAWFDEACIPDSPNRLPLIDTWHLVLVQGQPAATMLGAFNTLLDDGLTHAARLARCNSLEGIMCRQFLSDDGTLAHYLRRNHLDDQTAGNAGAKQESQYAINAAIREYVDARQRLHKQKKTAETLGVSRYRLWRYLEKGHAGRAVPAAKLDKNKNLHIEVPVGG